MANVDTRYGAGRSRLLYDISKEEAFEAKRYDEELTAAEDAANRESEGASLWSTLGSFTGGSDGKWSSGSLDKLILYELFDYQGWTPTSEDNVLGCKGRIQLLELDRKSYFLFKKFRTSKFHANVNGRTDSAGVYE